MIIDLPNKKTTESIDKSILVKSPPILGNRCGHDPQKPDFSVSINKSKLDFINLAIERLTQYYSDPNLLPSVNHATSTRQQRTERREAFIRFATVLINRTDFSSMRVGVPRPHEGFLNYRVKTLANEANISLKRAFRALDIMKKAGLITVFPISERKEDGEYKGHAATKKINPHFFGALGLGLKLSRERLRSSNRLKKIAKQNNISLSNISKVALVFGMPAKRRSTKQQQEKKAQEVTARNHNNNLNLMQKMIDLQDKYPNKPLSEIKEMAQHKS